VCIFVAVLVVAPDPVLNAANLSSAAALALAAAAEEAAAGGVVVVVDVASLPQSSSEWALHLMLWGNLPTQLQLSQQPQWNPRACVLAQNTVAIVLALCAVRLSLNALHRNQSIFKLPATDQARSSDDGGGKGAEVRACVRACVPCVRFFSHVLGVAGRGAPLLSLFHGFCASPGNLRVGRVVNGITACPASPAL
jgi:hypothetical protein